jgi:type VI secretion system VgrG family protein
MINLRFESRALPADTFQVLQFDGEEEISKLYHFELRLVSRDPDIDFEAVLKSSAQLAITAQGNTRYLNGMISRFDQGGQWQNGLYEYRAVLVPRLWIMAQSTQNQIFRELTVPDIVESELSSISKKGSHPLVRDGLSVDDYEIYTIRDYDEREYVVQYKETDHNFISRLMEHEGIYYYFEQDDIREKLVVTDAMATEEITGDSYAVFQSEVSATHYDSNVVYKLTRSQQQIPDSVLVNDFNYRSPSMPMQSDSLVDENGIGFVTEFGAHFKEPEQGQVLATLRAEEFRCRQNVYTGESNIAAMTCAGLYSLGKHFRREYNQSYMITRVRHSGSQEIESWGNVGSTRYNNEFDCIPSGMPYRPQRLALKPKLYGIMNGTIDSELDTGRADIDELGRYKVMMPFDISGVAPGMGSRRIRMAQPYGGGGSGMSFPLVKGTEVIWTCIDGDIDRPIITGAVPNPLNPSVTTHENNTSNVIKTTSGITVSFQDGTAGGSGTSSTSSNGLAAQQRQEGLSLDLAGDGASSSLDVGSGKQFSIAVPDYDATGAPIGELENKDSYLRLGMAGKAAEWEMPHFVEDGWVDYTDGDKLSVTQGKRTDIINGMSYKTQISIDDEYGYSDTFMSLKAAKGFNFPGYEQFALDLGASATIARKIVDFTHTLKYQVGSTKDFTRGTRTTAQISENNINLMGRFSLAGTGDKAVGLLGSKRFTVGTDQTYCTTHKLSSATQQTITGFAGVNINVKPPMSIAAALKTSIGLGALTGAITGVAGGLKVAKNLVTVGFRTVNTIKNVTSGTNSFAEEEQADSALVAIGTGAIDAAKTAVDLFMSGHQWAEKAAVPIAELSMRPVPPMARLGLGPGPISNPAMPGIQIMSNLITIGFGPANQISISPAGITIVAPTINLTATAGVKVTGGPSVAITGAKCDITAATSVGVKSPTLKTTVGMTTI